MANSQSIGNHSNNNTQNLYITTIEQRALIPTIIFNLLKYVKEFQSQNKENFELRKPVDLTQKLKFNNSRRYIHKFSDGINNYVLLAKVLEKEFPDSQKVVENVKNIFSDHTPIGKNGEPIVGNGDECLKNMHEDIKGRIASDPSFLSSNIDDLELDKFIVALLQYGVMKCQILLNPNNYKESDDVIA